jgi:hypothetical protein
MSEAVWICDECSHIFTDEQAHDEMHPCFGCGKSKKPWVCESFLAKYVPATSLERKPLDGYDWRADVEALDALPLTIQQAADCTARLAAYIEALEAPHDA